MKILMTVLLIRVTPMPHVPTMLVHFSALVMLATLVTALIVLMIMNAMMVLTTAMQILLAPTFQDHSNAHVTTKKTTRKNVTYHRTHIIWLI